MLYVDDEPDIREVAVMSLELEPDFDIRSCASGQEALDTILGGWVPDVILLDVMMPGMDGRETYARLQGAGCGAIPVIFITARTQREDIDRLIELGARGVIAKPFDPLSLAGDVQHMLANN